MKEKEMGENQFDPTRKRAYRLEQKNEMCF